MTASFGLRSTRALWFNRRQRRPSPAKLPESAGGMDYSAVSVAVRPFSERIAKDTKLRRKLEEIERPMAKVEITPRGLGNKSLGAIRKGFTCQ